MSLKITNATLFTRHYLIVKPAGIQYYDGSGFTGAKNIPFDRIDCVLLSPANVLSVQIDDRVFTIPVKPGNPKHQAVIDALVEGLRRTQQGLSPAGN